MRAVFVHGFTQSERSWHRVRWTGGVALRVPDGLSFVDTASALADIGGRATYVGYSMGGRLCLQVALDRPDNVERLALISASPGIEDETERARRVEADEQLARDIERDGVDAFVERWLAQPMFATLPRDSAGVDERKLVNSVERLTHQLRALGQGAQPDNWPRLGELAMPVLLVAGALDTKYVDIAHRMSERIRNARVVAIDGAGHACHLERPDDVAHALTSW